MTPSHIIERRRAARRRRRIIGFVRLAVFLSAIVLTGLSLAAIGNADETGTSSSRSQQSAVRSGHHAAVRTSRAKPVPRKVRSAHRRAPHLDRAVASTNVVTRQTDARVAVVRPASAQLPMTGSGLGAVLALGGALLVVCGQLMQIAGMPLRARL